MLWHISDMSMLKCYELTSCDLCVTLLTDRYRPPTVVPFIKCTCVTVAASQMRSILCLNRDGYQPDLLLDHITTYSGQ